MILALVFLNCMIVKHCFLCKNKTNKQKKTRLTDLTSQFKKPLNIVTGLYSSTKTPKYKDLLVYSTSLL